jgi:quercetin dioxygenase-like cupin family protein
VAKPMGVIGKMNLPFEQNDLSENVKIRTFSSNTDIGEFTWHRDREDRVVELIEGENWYVQLDNELPKKLVKENKVFIPKGVYHRVIKGEGDLTVKIQFVNV